MLPNEIEKQSFAIITEELERRKAVIPKEQEPILKRVIHTTADFEYVDTLCFSQQAIEKGIAALRQGVCIVTDTNMALAGINKQALAKTGSTVRCFMAEEAIAYAAASQGTTRAAASMKAASKLKENCIVAVGNAPTALLCLAELVQKGIFLPKLIIGVPVGFVNVVESKELCMSLPVPYIVAKGRKGGSNVAAAIVNALLYQAIGRTL